MSKLYTLNEVANILHLTRRTLYTHVKQGRLAAIKVGGNWRVTEETLNAITGGKEY